MDERLAASVEGTVVQWRALTFLALAELLGMTLWFSASAVVPSLELLPGQGKKQADAFAAMMDKANEDV